MTNKQQLWVIGTDMSGRTKYGAPNAEIDFDLATEIGVHLKPGSNQILFCFRKEQQMVGAAAYIHAKEPDFNRAGNYAGVAIEFVSGQIPNVKEIFSYFEQVINEFRARLECGSNNVLTFHKPIKEIFGDWETLCNKYHEKLEGREIFACRQVVADNSRVMVLLPQEQLVTSCFIAFLQQNVYKEMFLTTDVNFGGFKTHQSLEINELLYQGITQGIHSHYKQQRLELEKLQQKEAQLRHELGELKKNFFNARSTWHQQERELQQELGRNQQLLTFEREKWQQQESDLKREIQQNLNQIAELEQKATYLMQEGLKVVQQGKNIERRLKEIQDHARQASEKIQNYRHKHDYLFLNQES